VAHGSNPEVLLGISLLMKNAVGLPNHSAREQISALRCLLDYEF
jgi:hypothetical protein